MIYPGSFRLRPDAESFRNKLVKEYKDTGKITLARLPKNITDKRILDCIVVKSNLTDKV